MTRRYRPPHPRAPQYETGSSTAPPEAIQLATEANALANKLCAAAKRAVNGRVRERWLLAEPWQIERKGATFILVLKSQGGVAYHYGQDSLLSPGAARILIDEIRDSGGVERWLREQLRALHEFNDLF